jgi:plastocyanin
MYFLILVTIVGILGSSSLIFAEVYEISIPFGAYNPELNTPAEVWYDPPQMFVTIDDTITWYNDDREGHTVTSGKGSGRFGWMSDDFGTPNGYFHSDRFMPGESWSYNFEESGTFPYYCTIHPWMEGVVIVEKNIPDYPHDATGKKLAFPLLQYTPDKNIEVNLTWDPPIIKTHEKIQFVYQFYDPQTNSNLAKMKYTIIIFQDGKEIFRDDGLNQIGGDYRNFVFSDSGSIIIRIEGIQTSSILAEESVTVFGNVENKALRTVDFTTVVYDNSEKTNHEVYHVKPAQRLESYYELMITIILIPALLFIGILFWIMKKPKLPTRKAGAVSL